jgi:hypothetical protein
LSQTTTQRIVAPTLTFRYGNDRLEIARDVDRRGNILAGLQFFGSSQLLVVLAE